MAGNMEIEATIGCNEVNAKYKDDPGRFVHNIDFQSSEQFILAEHIITSGPHAGKKAYVPIRAPYFPFEKLPLELRQAIYKMVLYTEVEKTITSLTLTHARSRYLHWHAHVKPTRVSHWRAQGKPVFWHYRHVQEADKTRNYSIILVNRATSNEAKEFIYRPHHFTFPGMAIMLDWLDDIGKCKKYLTHITCEKSGHRLMQVCYNRLSTAVRLQYLKIALPGSLRASLEEHMDNQYQALKLYLLARGADQAKSLRRLDEIHFTIGRGQTGVTDSNGAVLRQMTPALQERCRSMIREKLQKHFDVLKWAAAKADLALGDPDAGDSSSDNESDESDDSGEINVELAVPSQQGKLLNTGGGPAKKTAASLQGKDEK